MTKQRLLKFLLRNLTNMKFILLSGAKIQFLNDVTWLIILLSNLKVIMLKVAKNLTVHKNIQAI